MLATFPLNAQLVIEHDTIKIHEVVISGKQLSSIMPGYKSLKIENESINNFCSSSLGEILTVLSPLSLKDYGAGGMSTPSLRGTAASHTLILWNGININNPMPAQSDLSLIIPDLMEEISISQGGSSMSSGNGGFGGAIELGNIPYWKKETRITVSSGMGSFGNLRGFVNAAISNGSFRSVTKGYFQTAENDFTYLDKYSAGDPIRKTRENGQTYRKGIMQELYFRKSGSVLSARVWYQTASTMLQQPVISQQVIGGEKQTDESLRSMIDYSLRSHRNQYSITAAWISNRLNYLNEPASIDSRNKTGTMIIKGAVSLSITENAIIKFILNNELNSVNSNNYGKNISRNNASVTLTAERRADDRLAASIMLREIIDNRQLLIPDFSAGMEFMLAANENYMIYSNFSRNSRIASLNDLYWLPGGNPDLKNEYAYLCEIGYRMKSEVSSPLSWNADISLFGNAVRNMIQWHPGENSYWTADNLNSVNTSGAESFGEIRFSGKKIDLRMNGGYTYTRSVNTGPEDEGLTGKQLIYIPENQVNGVIQIGYGSFYSVLVTDFTGRRFISADNSDFLPGYTRSNTVTGVKIKFSRISADISFRIDNLFNTCYESMAYYPQPGRAYFLTLKIQYDN